MTVDPGAVAKWMATHVPDVSGPVEISKITGGQSNPTYLVRTNAGDLVLRRKPSGPLLKSAHAVDREFRVQKALAGQGVPVAGMVAYCDDPNVIGTEFYIMDHVAGRGFMDPVLPGLSPTERSGITQEMARVLAAIHGVDVAKAGLSDYGPSGDYFRRQTDRWTKQYRASETEPVAAMDTLMARLDADCPADDGRVCLVHGDYRLDNLLFARTGTECVAVLDWELSTLGHPFADLAGVIMQWQMPPGPEGRGLAGVDRAPLGLISDAAFLDAYAGHAGLEIPADFGLYVAFSFFRMAAILQGVKKRAIDGNASDPERGLRMGTFVPMLAEAGLKAAG